MEVSPTSVSYLHLCQALEEDVIRWTGAYKDEEVLIHTLKGKWYAVDVSEISQHPPPLHRVPHNESLSGGGYGYMWSDKGWGHNLRVASTSGLVTGLRGGYGTARRPVAEFDRECVMGYDIETDMQGLPRGVYPFRSSRITIISVWCTCGYSHAWTTEAVQPRRGVTVVQSSTDLVTGFLARVYVHRPLWLVGHNSYCFDNVCMLCHTQADTECFFRPITLTGNLADQYAFYIDIPGVYNVDTFAYLSKTRSGRYENLTLGGVASHHGLGGKAVIGSLTTVGFEGLLEYNVQDSKLAAMIWRVTNCETEVINLSCVSSSPMLDCVRYVSGVMSACLVSAYCISSRTSLQWGKCRVMGAYEGGLVLPPSIGTHDKVYVMDFTSMYPTIHISAGLSQESVSTTHTHRGDGYTTWDASSSTVVVDGRSIKAIPRPSLIIPSVLEFLVGERRKVRNTAPDYAHALKVMSNSVYGSEGFSFSHLYSPAVASSVTLWGRWSLSVAYAVFSLMGLTIIYGDTDSCFVKHSRVTYTHFNSSMEDHTDTSLKILHEVLKHTPMRKMRMQREEPSKSPGSHYSRVILAGMKNYSFRVSDTGVIGYKGVAPVRKDRIEYAKVVTEEVISIILRGGGDMSLTRSKIGTHLRSHIDKVMRGTLSLKEVSKVTKVDGEYCYVYIDTFGQARSVPVKDAGESSRVDYSHASVIQSIGTCVGQTTVAAGYGEVEGLLKHGAGF